MLENTENVFFAERSSDAVAVEIHAREFTGAFDAQIGVAAALNDSVYPLRVVRCHVLPVRGIRAIGKTQRIHNDATPHMEVDPEIYQVRADGELLTCEPAAVLPMAQRYFLF